MTDGIAFGGYRPGALAALIGLHMAYYAPQWGFGAAFEAKLAGDMGSFVARLDPSRDLFLTAWGADGRLWGSITIDGIDGHDAAGSHLRWYIVADAARGRGLGAALMARAMAFVDGCGYRRCTLTTFAGLDAARALYERHGFALVAEETADPWSGTVGLQRFDRVRPPDAA